MTENESSFRAKSTIKSADLEHRHIMNSTIKQYESALADGKLQFADLNLAKERAKNIRWQGLETLDQHLEEFEMHFTGRGGKVIWAQDPGEAREAILKICKEKNCQMVVKGKSMVSEEIGLNPFLAENNIESIETDLGEYVQQLDEELPYHMLMPALHKSKEDMARLFEQKLGTPSKLSPQELTQVTRETMREKWGKASIGITGANFIISDIGGIAVTENEGNARLCASFPTTHIVIVGIEKMIPSVTDLALLWPLLSTYGAGQKITVYSHIISGPRQPGEVDGPEEMYVILLDHNRSTILADSRLRESLYCIRCGACMNVCPVYKNIGGHSYGATYKGPIGSVITPHQEDLREYKHLSFASTLCGACTEICPVKISLHDLLLVNRKESVEQGMTTFSEKMAWKAWKLASLKRALMNRGSGEMKSKVVGMLFKDWKKQHAPIEFAKKSFNELWKERVQLK